MSVNDLPTGSESHLRRTGFLIAAAFVVLVAILAAVVVFTTRGGGSHDGTPAGLAPEIGHHPPSTPRSGNGNACGLSDASQTIPSTTPPGVSWRLYDGIVLPFSTADGPGIRQGDVARCYAHTPVGALLAAAQIGARYLVATDWRAVVSQQVMPGAGRDTYVGLRAKASVSSPQSGGYGQLAAFQFVTYNTDQAVIELVSRLPDGTYQMITTTVVWSGDDWKLQLQPDGSMSPNAQQVPGLGGFVPWGGI